MNAIDSMSVHREWASRWVATRRVLMVLFIASPFFFGAYSTWVWLNYYGKVVQSGTSIFMSAVEEEDGHLAIYYRQHGGVMDDVMGIDVIQQGPVCRIRFVSVQSWWAVGRVDIQAHLDERHHGLKVLMPIKGVERVVVRCRRGEEICLWPRTVAIPADGEMLGRLESN